MCRSGSWPCRSAAGMDPHSQPILGAFSIAALCFPAAWCLALRRTTGSEELRGTIFRSCESVAEHTPDQAKGSDGRSTFWILHSKSDRSPLEFFGKAFSFRNYRDRGITNVFQGLCSPTGRIFVYVLLDTLFALTDTRKNINSPLLTI